MAAVRQVKSSRESGLRASAIPAELLTLAQQITEANAAIFDPANGFRGCIPGIHEVFCGVKGCSQGDGGV